MCSGQKHKPSKGLLQRLAKLYSPNHTNNHQHIDKFVEAMLRQYHKLNATSNATSNATDKATSKATSNATSRKQAKWKHVRVVCNSVTACAVDYCHI